MAETVTETPPVPLPLFPPAPGCLSCTLHLEARTVGIPARPAGYPDPVLPPGNSRALLVVGEAPGHEEDIRGLPFVGPAGLLLHRVYIDGPLNLARHADVFLTNAVRCRPFRNATPTVGQVSACRQHLVSEIRTLQSLYAEVVILCTGAVGVRSVLGLPSLSAGLSAQGEIQDWGFTGAEDLRPCVVFSTYHPVNLSSTRDPSKLAPIRDHLKLLDAYLAGAAVTPIDTIPYLVNPTPPPTLQRLALDIETYGFIRDEPEQTVFHPWRSEYQDRPHRLVHTVAVAWPETHQAERIGELSRGEDGTVKVGVFVWAEPAHRRNLLAFIRNLAPGGDLLGMNLKFDLSYLRYCDPLFYSALHPGLNLTDVSVLNYLHSEQRPERSLKSISELLQVASYKADRKRTERFRSDRDPALWAYNAKDAYATLEAVRALERHIVEDYPHTRKLTSYSRRTYSRLLWSCIQMEEAGIAFDQQKLEDLDFSSVLRGALLYSECRHKYGLVLAGPGSDKSKEALYLRALEESGLAGDSRVSWTSKQQRLAINQENAHLFLQHLPVDSASALQLRRQQEYEKLSKMVTSYTRPMLHGTTRNPVKSRVIPDGSRLQKWNSQRRPGTLIAYPSWFPVPSSFDSGLEGGTIQGRITSKGPACQVLPPAVKSCMTSRYLPGFLIVWDLSQIEMRIAALLSGDAQMLREYREGVDRHSRTAQSIIRHLLLWMRDTGRGEFALRGRIYTPGLLREIAAHPEPRIIEAFSVFREIGKTTNFLIIYLGSPSKLQHTLAADLEISLPEPVCDEIIREQRDCYPGLAAWQKALIRQAQKTGRIELPLIGASRMFLGSARAVRDTYTSEIVNFPLQFTAAWVMLDIQAALYEALSRRRKPVHVGLNIYDSLFADGPLSELPFVQEIARRCFQSSDYVKRLEDLLARSVPVEYDERILVRDRLHPSRST